MKKRAIHKDSKLKFVDVDKLDYYLNEGWLIGRGIKPWNKGLKGAQVAWNKGKTTPQKTKLKISESLKGRKLSKEHIMHRTQAQTGLKRSEKFKHEQSLRFLGHEVTEETRKKISEKNKGKSHPQTEYAKKVISIHNSSKEFQEYQREIKRKNHSFNTSQPELSVKSKLESLFGTENVFYQYSNSKYPFSCDFYIKSNDLYIECNFHWTHGPHPFDKNNPEDIELLNKIKQKQDYYVDGTGHKKKNFYYLYERIWTIKDPEKLNYAKNNSLNYLAFYKLKDFEIWYEGSASDLGTYYYNNFNK